MLAAVRAVLAEARATFQVSSTIGQAEIGHVPAGAAGDVARVAGRLLDRADARHHLVKGALGPVPAFVGLFEELQIAPFVDGGDVLVVEAAGGMHIGAGGAGGIEQNADALGLVGKIDNVATAEESLRLMAQLDGAEDCFHCPTSLKIPSDKCTTRCILRASSKLWVATSVARPSSATRCMNSAWTRSEVFGSRLPVGSSASSRPGRLASARAMATRCCSPPESSAGR